MNLTPEQKQELLEIAYDAAMELWYRVGKDVALMLVQKAYETWKDNELLGNFLKTIIALMGDTSEGDDIKFDIYKYLIEADANCKPVCDDPRLGGKGCVK